MPRKPTRRRWKARIGFTIGEPERIPVTYGDDVDGGVLRGATFWQIDEEELHGKHQKRRAR